MMSRWLSLVHGRLASSQDRIARTFARRIAMLATSSRPTANVAIRLDALLQVHATLEAALALLGYDLPGWSVRQLAQDGDGWHCLLSRNPALPIDLDDPLAGDGQTPAHAILIAMAAERCRDRQASQTRDGAEGSITGELLVPGVACDDYA